jgi:hypothetical protein
MKITLMLKDLTERVDQVKLPKNLHHQSTQTKPQKQPSSQLKQSLGIDYCQQQEWLDHIRQLEI